jgi:ABC-type transporter Mla subunit MlaD
MRTLTVIDRQTLIYAIANREAKAGELAARFGLTVAELRQFVDDNRDEIEQTRDSIENAPMDQPTPTQLDQLWISNKFERLKRLQECAEILYQDATTGGLSGADLSTAVREFRSYLMLAANELGQLLHRGSGDGGSGDTLSVDISGVDMDTLK